jgi:uncharacterized protein
MVQHFRLIGLVLLISVSFGSMAKAASFDCNKATTETEIAICDDFDLSIDDRIISYLFKKHLEWRKGREAWFSGQAFEVSRQEIITDQTNWLIEIRNPCGGNLNCLTKAMDLRIDHFFNLVRLEKPRSGTNWQVYIRSSNNSKNALRLLGGILENVQRHGVLPSMKDLRLSYFSENSPHLSGANIINLHNLEKITDTILAENTSREEQLKFGRFTAIDYLGLNQCLLGRSLTDISWRGDWVWLSSKAEFECFSFHWPDGFIGDETRSNGSISVNDDPIFDGAEEFILFPLLESKFISIDYSQINNFFEICSTENYKLSCENDKILALDNLRASFLTQYLSQTSRTTTDAIEIINQNSQFVSDFEKCDGENCIKNSYLNNLQYINKLIQHDGEIPPHCKFDQNGIYTCGGNNICIVGESVFQMSKSSDDKYKLDIWKDYWKYDPWNGGEDPSYSLEGSRGFEGTYPCTHDVYYFGGITMSYGGCRESAPEPTDTMFQVSCDSDSTFCPSGSWCTTAHMQ